MIEPSLEHLVIVPTLGLANRMRAIASAKRLAQSCGARCTVVWDWQDYNALFAADPTIEVIPQLSEDMVRTYYPMRTKKDREGGTPENRRIPLNGPTRIVLSSCHCFSSQSDPKPLYEADLLEWIAQPSEAVRERVRMFRAQVIKDRNIVGFHMRRTDNRPAIMQSPNWLFYRQAKSIAGSGALIYLATDNRKTERKMLARFGESIVGYPKNPKIAQRWPREFSLEEIIDDYVDLLLLASCNYVLGSKGSSYSRVAMALNRSPLCRPLVTADVSEMNLADLAQAALHELYKLYASLRYLVRPLQPGIGIGRWLRSTRSWWQSR